MVERIVVPNNKMKDIQAYIDYQRIVGVDDGGKMMTDEEFEAYKEKVREARKNHLYVNWTNIKGHDCKAIGPESMCFCGHRYKAHNFDNVKSKKVNCKDKKCKCPIFNYIPIHGSNDIKCLCHHSYSLHDSSTRKCTKLNCKCNTFGSKFTCNCTYSYDDHNTTIETRQERISRGKNVDPLWMAENLTGGMGGLNSFGSMVQDINSIGCQKMMGQDDNFMLEAGNIDNNMMKMLGNQEGTGMGMGMSNQDKIMNSNSSGGMKLINSNLDDSALNLFRTPHRFGRRSVRDNNTIDRKFNQLSLN